MISPDELKTITQELIQHLGLTLDVEITDEGELFLVNLVGSDTRFLERISDSPLALMTVIKLMAKTRQGSEPKLVIDLNSQRKTRLENIAQMARKTAELVRVRGSEEELRPMSPAERRAVHVALKEMPGIRTESRGVEPHRRIVIIPENGEE